VATAACTFPSSSTICRPASCTSGTATLQAGCNGAGACPAVSTVSCGAFMCSGSTCAGGCTTDAGCTAGNYCAGGTCVPQKITGAACSALKGCGSGICVDGVCCDAACGGQCEACNLTGKAGTCSAVTGAPALGHGACATDGSLCGGSCNGINRGVCTYPDGSK